MVPVVTAFPTRLVLSLTARDQITDRIRGPGPGADDHLVKPFDPEELVMRLRAVERRRSAWHQFTVTVGDLAADPSRSTVHGSW